jgi:hypothetical protein
MKTISHFIKILEIITLIVIICLLIFKDSLLPFLQLNSNSVLIILVGVICLQSIHIFLNKKELINELKDESNKSFNKLEEKVKKVFDDIAYIKNETSSIVFSRDSKDIDKEILKMFNLGKGKSIKIICYGTSAYGNVIPQLYTNFKDAKIEVVVCSPSSNILSNQLDKDILGSVIEQMKENNVEVSISKIPPTIRASLVYNSNNEPVWCAVQSYYIFDKRPQFRGAAFTPTLIGKENNPVMLKELSEIFEKEFVRLKSSGK